MANLRSHSLFNFAAFNSLALALTGVAHAQTDAKQAPQLVDFFRPGGIIPAIFYIALGIGSLRLMRKFADRFSNRFSDRRLLIQQVETILHFVIYSLVILQTVRSLFFLERETILALLGTLAVAIGFGLKDLAASVLAGITIIFDHPFQVGDRVKFAGEYGEIVSIGLRSVRLVTLDDSTVTIPNNKFLTEMVTSCNTGELSMQVVINFFVAPDANIPKAKEIINEGVRTSRFVYLEKPVTVLVADVIQEGYIATRIQAKAYVLDVRYEKLFESDVTERVKQSFANVGIALPTRREQLVTPTPARPPAISSARR